MTAFSGFRLGLPPEQYRDYRKARRIIGADAARKAFGLPPEPVTPPLPSEPLLLPIFTNNAEAIGRAAKLSSGTISSWRHGRSPRLDNLQAALRACGFRLQLAPIYEDAAE